MDLELTPAEAERLQAALLSAFPHRGDLVQLIYFRLEQDLDQIVPNGNYADDVYNLIKWANAAGKAWALLSAAYDKVPDSPRLRKFYQRIKVRPGPPDSTSPRPHESSLLDKVGSIIGKPVPHDEAILLLDDLGDLKDSDQRRILLRVRLADGDSFESAPGRYINGVYFFIHPITKTVNQPRPEEISEITVLSVRGLPPPNPNISDVLIKDLIGALLGMSHVQTFEGRTNLLTGLPGITAFTRIQTNAQNDLEGVVAQLQARGRMSSGEWPLLKLIDNALPYVKGYELGDQLSKVRQSLAQIYQEV